ncbi:MAG: 50S ribosomal protein L31 [bacterium]|nr:50S ribosomal protein L31 [bacterium]
MKKEIHPEYYPKAKIQCACGAVFNIGAAKPEVKVEICSQCHPFYTGKEELLDIAGRVEKFKARKAQAKTTVAKHQKKAVKKSLKKKK